MLGEPSAPESAGLTRLDRERAASVADEGGASGAMVESQETAPTVRPRGGSAWRLAAFGLGCLAAWRLARRARRG
jgi:hypothetical protein